MILRAIVLSIDRGPGCRLSFSLSFSLLLRFTRLGLAKKRSHPAQSDGGGMPLTIALRRPGINTTLGLAAG